LPVVESKLKLVAKALALPTPKGLDTEQPAVKTYGVPPAFKGATSE
jgi:hypothetical protein